MVKVESLIASCLKKMACDSIKINYHKCLLNSWERGFCPLVPWVPEVFLCSRGEFTTTTVTDKSTR